MLQAFDRAAGSFHGGKGTVSLAVKSGQGGLALTGYTHDDLVNYGNPANIKRLNFPWREHFIGMGLTHTELKHDGGMARGSTLFAILAPCRPPPRYVPSMSFSFSIGHQCPLQNSMGVSEANQIIMRSP
jgi:hypothetical protein